MDTKIDIVGPNEIPLVADLYNQIFRPSRDAAFFRRRFQGRCNILMLVASAFNEPAGFYIGFELKPTMYFSWFYGVLPQARRQGIASQLMDAVHAWVAEQGYDGIRFECHNQHRPMLHLAIERRYDIMGIRWDPDRGDNLVIFERSLKEGS